MVSSDSITRHNEEILAHRQMWEKKPLLKKVYRDLYTLMANEMASGLSGPIVEVGAGIGAGRETVPEMELTDIFPNPWVDRVESIYNLSYREGTVSNLLLLDVFHHLQFPGSALQECLRVLEPGGRLIILEPCQSLLGLVVYGALHVEPLGLRKEIEWERADGKEESYYAAQGNAWRIFGGEKYSQSLNGWILRKRVRHAALSYVASGGFRPFQLYPESLYEAVRKFDKVFDIAPALFATRFLVVLEKR